MTKVENLAEKHLVVDSIEVLHDITGKGMTKIEGKVNLLTQSVSTVSKAQQQYIRDITADNIIDITEKRALKRNFEQIQRTHAELMKVAKTKGVLDTVDVTAYNDAFNDLYNYLIKELKVFDDMSANTQILDADKYQKVWTNYDALEASVQSILNAGKDGKIKLLNNLLDTVGYSLGDIALYEGAFFRLEAGGWKAIRSSDYLGAWTSIPTGTIDSYFLSPVAFEAAAILYTHRGKLGTTDGKELSTARGYSFRAGFLYLRVPQGWKEISDRTDYRYTIALQDFIKYNLEIPPKIAEWASKIEKDAMDNVPHYLGLLQMGATTLDGDFSNDILPVKTGDAEVYYKRFNQNENAGIWQVYHAGDWFTWGGNAPQTLDDVILKKGNVYMCNEITAGSTKTKKWIELDPQDTAYTSQFMGALNDILANHSTDNAYFGAVFCRTFFANKAAIENLAVHTIELDTGGVIKSKGYGQGSGAQGQRGFWLNNDGQFEFAGGTMYGVLNVDKLHFFRHYTAADMETESFDNGDIWMVES